MVSGLSGAFVVLASSAFADLGHPLLVDLAFAAWLAYTVTFTFVRYGVLDQARRAPSMKAGCCRRVLGKIDLQGSALFDLR